MNKCITNKQKMNVMKKLLFLLMACPLVMFASCDDDDPAQEPVSVVIELEYPEADDITELAGVTVKVESATASFDAVTDANGRVSFNLNPDYYTVTVEDIRSHNGNGYKYVATTRQAIDNAWDVTAPWIVKLTKADFSMSQVIIKEIYTGGCQNDEGSGTFAYDRYIILYNNSDAPASLGDICLATTLPYLSSGSNNYIQSGTLSYEAEGWMPAGLAVWHFQNNVVIEPGKQIVIAMTNAIDNTNTYKKSVNFANPEYYCTYDLDVFSHALTYVTPSELIPTSHYLKAQAYGSGTAWTLANQCPGLFIFAPEGCTPAEFAKDTSRETLHGSLVGRKVPVEWIKDGVEVFWEGRTNQKRFVASVDNGSILHQTGFGYSVYRNVDKEATEALSGNAGKLVYSYTKGTVDVVDKYGTTDPSDIDAEASIKNGARIIYKDTNNSTNDFHLRRVASLANGQ